MQLLLKKQEVIWPILFEKIVAHYFALPVPQVKKYNFLLKINTVRS